MNPAADPPPAAAPPARPLLRVADLVVSYRTPRRLLGPAPLEFRAVDGVCFEIERGQTLGLVGESGSGKTTVGRAVLGLVEPASGSITFDGHNIRPGHRESRAWRRKMQIVFQDPAGSLNPRMKVADIVAEPLVVHRLVRTAAQRRERVAELLRRCGMDPAAADRYPHQFSGGQRQRIAIARALAPEPAFIVCDEPTSALDVSVQAQIVNLLMSLQEEFHLSYLFISHDIALVQHTCRNIAVMQRGRIVEQGPAAQVLGAPAHPYTKALLEAAVATDPALQVA